VADDGARNVEKMRVIIAGGGTGGHFFPGLAVAQALRAGAPSASVLFAGTSRGIEARLAPKYGFPFAALPGSGVAGVGLARRLRGLVSVPLAMVRSLLLLDRFQPQAVVGVGGYASFPVALTSGLLGVPVLLLEQNVTPGLANRVLSLWACAVATAFPQTLRHFRGKGRLMGNPVRASLAAVPCETAPERPFRLLVFGGSRGARAINDAVLAALPELAAFPGGLEIRHQTGTEDLERVSAAYAAAGVPARVEPFIDAMDEAYAWCHAALCRAGATTLAELSAARRPALLVPFPQAAGDHQLHNARGLESLGGALCIEQRDLSTPRLMEALNQLAEPARRRPMAAALASVARPRAAEEIAALVREMTGVRP
jgi:UDP-N-acetylglucosamine--N-acetylmuramyl-(pentapeptide) pyrophosphoryl-undecaprenol N-acetylglucosamine transferase